MDVSCGIDHSDEIVEEVPDIDTVGGIDVDAGGKVEHSRGGWSAVASIPRGAAAGVGGDVAGGTGDHADKVVLGIDDVGVAAAVEGDALGKAQVCLDGGVGRSNGGIKAGIATEAAGIGDVSGEGRNLVRGLIDFTDDVVSGVGNVNVVTGIDAQCPGIVKGGRSGCATIAK